MEASAQPLRRARAARTQTGPLVGLIVQAVVLGALASTVGLSPVAWFIALACGAALDAALARGLVRFGSDRLGAADWVTLTRASLGVGVAALVADSFAHPASVALLVSITSIALALDFLDGWVARQTRTAAALGAWFDGEVDAFLILVLSVYVARSAGTWVLAIGGARYLFLAAGWVLAWLRGRLPTRYWRKVVTATQGIALTVAAADVLPLGMTRLILVGALGLLVESFARDVWWLWSHRKLEAGADPPIVALASDQSRPRTGLGAVITVLAVLVVWTALVAPDQPQDLTPTAFLRVPLEGLVLIALAVVLPTSARRILAGLVGPVLGLVLIVTILDIGFFTVFARPFDPVGDLANLSTGVQTLRDSIGPTEANLIVIGGVALGLALLAVTTLALFRLTRVAADNRRWSLGTIAALGVVWVTCSVSGARLVPNSPIASTNAASLVVREVRTVQADLRDYGTFAKQIVDDRFRYIPGSRLLTGLRGKDVLLVFVEAYGQVSVQNSSFSPAIDALLKRGTEQLRTAGFSARSAFLDAPGFGGLSWLAHSTLQSGVWANSQQRYSQLVDSHRFNLTEAFNRAGWRTINFAPADEGAWHEGASFYHYAKLYDRHNIGYRGPGFTYAPMPDQYMYAALQRLELSKTNRGPLFAEVDTVSSHMPWNRIPHMIPWSDVGNGSIFNRIPMFRAPNSLWWHPNQVKAAYARSLEYSLRVLLSFIQHYGKKNLVLVVAGDEQPLPIVSGKAVSHDVPVSIIAHDPAVINRIKGWDWQAGLLPSPRAPVWRMSAFRNRFLTAYGPRRSAGGLG